MADLSSSSTPNDNTKSWIACKAVVTGSDFETEGYIVSFTQVKLTFPYICLWCLYVYISALLFPYIFLLVDHFKWASHWWHWTVKSSLFALAFSNWGVYCQFYLGKTDLFLYICLWYLYVYISALVFPYIFLFVDHFEWALIGNIAQWWVHSVLWQFWMGGFIISFTWVNLKIWTFF